MLPGVAFSPIPGSDYPPLHNGGSAGSLSLVYPKLESLGTFSLDALNSELQWSIIAVSHSVSQQFFHIPDPEDEKKNSNTISNMPRAISRRASHGKLMLKYCRKTSPAALFQFPRICQPIKISQAIVIMKKKIDT